jgi:hypothetical protein
LVRQPACGRLRGVPRFEALLADPQYNAPLFCAVVSHWLDLETGKN